MRPVPTATASAVSALRHQARYVRSFARRVRRTASSVSVVSSPATIPNLSPPACSWSSGLGDATRRGRREASADGGGPGTWRGRHGSPSCVPPAREADRRSLQPRLLVLLLPLEGDAVPGLAVPDGGGTARDVHPSVDRGSRDRPRSHDRLAR